MTGAPPDETGEGDDTDARDHERPAVGDGPTGDGDTPTDGGNVPTSDPESEPSEDGHTAGDDAQSDVRAGDPDREVVEAVEEATGITVEDDADGADEEPTAAEPDADSGGTGGETDPAASDPADDATTAGTDARSADGPSVAEAPSDAAGESESVGDAEPASGATDSDHGPAGEPRENVPEDVRKYDRFKKIEGGTYDRANEFLRDRTYITAREWAIARLCADFRTETGVEMTKIGENLPELVPFMTDTYTPQAVNQARAAFEEKVRKAGATFLYGAMCDFFTAEELDDVMYESTEVAKFLLEVEGVELSVDEELEAEDRISEVMRDVRQHSAALRHDEVSCPECGHDIDLDG